MSVNYWREYNRDSTITFHLIDAGATDFESTPVTFASGDVQVMQNTNAFANSVNSVAHEGNGIYSLVADETECDGATTQVHVTIIDQSSPKLWEDQDFSIDLYGNNSALHEFNLNQNALDDKDAELSGIPAANATFAAKLNWLFLLSRNKKTQTGTTATVRNDADDGDIATSTVSDDATTTTYGEWT